MPTPGIELTGVNHVVTMVKETQRSVDFYCGLLGFKQIPSMVDNENITWLQLPSGVMLHLIQTDEAPVRPENVHHAFEVRGLRRCVENFGSQRRPRGAGRHPPRRPALHLLPRPRRHPRRDLHPLRLLIFCWPTSRVPSPSKGEGEEG